MKEEIEKDLKESVNFECTGREIFPKLKITWRENYFAEERSVLLFLSPRNEKKKFISSKCLFVLGFFFVLFLVCV